MSNINDFVIEDGVLEEYTGKGGKIVIPEGVTCIGRYAFSDCDEITSVAIPDTVTKIEGSAFENCTKLASITIPDSVKEICFDAFAGTRYFKDKKNWQNDVLYIGNHLIKANKTISGSCIIKDGTVLIADDAFSGCKMLESVNIPNSVKSIGSSAFQNCSELTEVTIPDSVTNIPSYAFNFCEKLASITLPDSITSIGSGAFGYTAYYNDASNWQNGVFYVGNFLLKAQSTLSGKYAVKDGTIFIAYSAFDNCNELTSISIPKSVKYIDGNVFSGCSSLDSITVEEGNPVYHSSGYCLIKTGSKTLLSGCNNSVIPNDGSVEKIYHGAFRGCVGLKTIVIPDSVVEIEGSSFADCKNLESVTLSKSIKKIESYTFGGCEKLAEISIPDSVTEIDYGVFNDCNTLSKITIGSGLQDMSESGEIAKGCESISFIEVSAKNEHLRSIDNCLVFIDENKLVIVGKDGKIPEDKNITKIGKYAFSGRKGLKTIVVPSNITEIGVGAFSECENLESVSIPESVTKIGSQAFIRCKSLKTLLIPSTVKEIGSDIFMYANTTVVCKENSYAHKYAKKNKIKFEII